MLRPAQGFICGHMPCNICVLLKCNADIDQLAVKTKRLVVCVENVTLISISIYRQKCEK